ncbi:hypothetical protein QR680_008210 [Steinernema hermaphroditum]|uniref:Uncharacterized protein n=1 Tax=Steinernema hermaphroditum TaxID=289476 RepID=A0AA39M7N2_9BILA|nr:hypothetical protein QR680_008210 [Steinernema hermaphroditum]
MMGAIVELYLSDDEELEGESMLCVVDVCDVILSAVCSKLANRFERKRRLDLAIEEAEEVAVDMRSVELAIGVIGRVMFTARNDPEVSGGFGLRGQFEGEEQRLSTRRVGSGGRLEKITSTMKRLIRIVESNPKHCPQELKLLSGSVGTLVESMEGQSTVLGTDSSKPSTSTKDELELYLRDLDDPTEAVHGHSLIMLARWMRERPKSSVGSDLPEDSHAAERRRLLRVPRLHRSARRVPSGKRSLTSTRS